MRFVGQKIQHERALWQLAAACRWTWARSSRTEKKKKKGRATVKATVAFGSWQLAAGNWQLSFATIRCRICHASRWAFVSALAAAFLFVITANPELNYHVPESAQHHIRRTTARTDSCNLVQSLTAVEARRWPTPTRLFSPLPGYSLSTTFGGLSKKFHRAAHWHRAVPAAQIRGLSRQSLTALRIPPSRIAWRGAVIQRPYRLALSARIILLILGEFTQCQNGVYCSSLLS